MPEKKSQPESKDLRSSILDEISQYKFSGRSAGQQVKRFVWGDPTKKESPKAKVPVAAATDSNKATVTVPMENLSKRRSARLRWPIIGPLGVVLVLAGFVLIFYQAELYKSSPALARFLPWPAAIVNGQMLPLSDFTDDVQTLTEFYIRAQLASNSSVDIDEKQIETAVAERMVNEALVADFASRNNIIVADQMVTDELSRIAQDFGSPPEMELFIKENYNWSLAQFEVKVIKPYLQRQQIEAWFQQNQSAQTAAADNINKVAAEINAGMEFSEAARVYSQDETNALYGGYLGVFERGVMVPEFEEALLKLEIGEVSPPVQTIFGWHIIKREPVPNDEGYQVTDLAASHILVKVFDFDKWLQDEKSKASVWMLLKLEESGN
ncbi:TPA: hypothetical protein DIC39_03100 [Patescibacteria group bacterium]|nr:MAG: Foldase protein PrsA [Parcubacteria group bacterium GW2011_GWA2_46_39]HBV33694.1 hypothetical protein [Patescibacteria group bacterium]HCU48016.1 hypothetical protein [Patescibacteria group bacterium]